MGWVTHPFAGFGAGLFLFFCFWFIVLAGGAQLGILDWLSEGKSRDH